jgi:hypothetical protein
MVTMVSFFSRESDKPPRCSFLSARGGIQNPKCEPWMRPVNLSIAIGLLGS